jgi:flagellar hook-basal body complex protein FliE
MSDIPVKPIGNISVPDENSKTNPLQEEKGSNFDSVINEAINKVSQVQEDAEKAVDALASGGDITDAVLAIEKADMSFQLMVEIRNKLLMTYEEVMKMQV